MRKAISCFLLVLIFVFPSILLSQEKRKGMDLFKFRYLYSPLTLVDSNDVPDDFRISTHSFHVEGTVPYFVKETKTLFLNGISYNLLTVHYDADDVLEEQNNDFHIIQYKFILMQMLPKNWNVSVLLMPAIASDLEGFSFRDIRANSGVLFGYRFRKNLNFQMGVMYLSNFGEDMIVPSLGLQYKSDKLRVFLNVPAFVEFWYVPWEFLEFGLLARMEGSQFHIHRKSVDIDYAKQSMVNVGPAIRAFPYKGIFIKGWGGITAYNRLELFEHENRVLELSPDPNWFVSVGVGYGF